MPAFQLAAYDHGVGVNEAVVWVGGVLSDGGATSDEGLGDRGDPLIDEDCASGVWAAV